MKRKILLFLFPAVILFLSMAMCKSHNINWNEMTSFRLYDFRFDKPLNKLTETDIAKMKYVETDVENAKDILKHASELFGTGYLWKGRYLAIATFKNGDKKKIMISDYGGFFLDLEGDDLYEFSGTDRERWESFIQASKQKLYK